MSLRFRLIFLAFTLNIPLAAHAENSTLHISCNNRDMGAEVFIDGKLKGVCPIEIKIPPGNSTLRVVKKVDGKPERIFEQKIIMQAGVVRDVEATLTETPIPVATQHATGKKSKAERRAEQTEAAKRKEAERRSQEVKVQQAAEIAQLRANFDASLLTGSIKASFRDCADCPVMVAIPPGVFDMGSNNGVENERPMHQVRLLYSFAMGMTEVSEGEWRAVMGKNHSQFSGLFGCGDNCPAENVSWDDAQAFIKSLNEKTGKKYRLPTEAEWEYACRAGGATAYCGSDYIDDVAWYSNNSDGGIHLSAKKQANEFGLYDMSGNVWEWVEDSFHDNYNGSPNDGSAWQGDITIRVLRGGSWSNNSQGSRTLRREEGNPVIRNKGNGFRLARTLP